MGTPQTLRWQRSSYSGGGEGNDCVEIAELDDLIAVRDSKTPARVILTFPAPAFVSFLDALKASPEGGR
ncbi:DUF397 domain-containing protein [Streptomyces sp. HMX87]|uniref:DUF397 domain-containing protein n=1 Tax=Streptomyces sp. HMX87 TaxID=3390849 RepID=UPI003A8B87A1